MTETAVPRKDAGFTLVEVMIALVILAVGLLSLEALGIGAARMVNRAQLQSQYVTAAADTLEPVMAALRDDLIESYPTSTVPVRNGSMVVTAARNGTMWTVSATITPASSSLFSADETIQVTSYVFDPD